MLMKYYASPKTPAKCQSVPVTVVDRQGSRVSVESNDCCRLEMWLNSNDATPQSAFLFQEVVKEVR